MIMLLLLLMTMLLVGVVFCPLALIIVKLFPQKSLIREWGFAPVLIFLVTFSWAIYNFTAVSDCLTMAFTSDSCWTVYKTVDNVDGLYLEYVGYSGQQAIIDPVLRFSEYSEIEKYWGAVGGINGEPIIKVDSKDHPRRDEISKRALTYGIRSKKEQYGGIFRITNTLMNFDTGEVFAKEIFYEFKEVQSDGNWLKFSTFTTYHPQGDNRPVEINPREKYLKVFTPR